MHKTCTRPVAIAQVKHLQSQHFCANIILEAAVVCVMLNRVLSQQTYTREPNSEGGAPVVNQGRTGR